jgi:hypothetical protein
MKDALYTFSFWKQIRREFNKSTFGHLCLASNRFEKMWREYQQEIRELANEWHKMNPDFKCYEPSYLGDGCLFYSMKSKEIRVAFIRAMCKKFSQK